MSEPHPAMDSAPAQAHAPTVEVLVVQDCPNQGGAEQPVPAGAAGQLGAGPPMTRSSTPCAPQCAGSTAGQGSTELQLTGGTWRFHSAAADGSIYGGSGSYAVGLVALGVVALLVLGLSALMARTLRRPNAVSAGV